MSNFKPEDSSNVSFYCYGCKYRHFIPINSKSFGPTWLWNESLESPTLSPSINVVIDRWEPPATPENPNPGVQHLVKYVCHSFVTDGKIKYLDDSTHEFAGQTLDL